METEQVLKNMLRSEYVLNDDGTFRPAESLEEWSNAFHSKTRIIRRDHVPGYNRESTLVSTVFLGIDTGWMFGKHPPVLFETMTFPDQDCERYTNIDDARIGHGFMMLSKLPSDFYFMIVTGTMARPYAKYHRHVIAYSEQEAREVLQSEAWPHGLLKIERIENPGRHFVDFELIKHKKIR